MARSVIAIDVDDTLVANVDGELVFNDFLIEEVKKAKQKNPGLEVVLFTSYDPRGASRHIEGGVARSAIVKYLREKGLEPSQVVVTESNQYEALQGIKPGDYYNQVIVNFEQTLIRLKEKNGIDIKKIDQVGQAMDDQINKLIQRPEIKQTKDEDRTDEKIKEEEQDYIHKMQTMLQAFHHNEFSINENYKNIFENVRNGLQGLNIPEKDAEMLAKQLIMAALCAKANMYSKEINYNKQEKTFALRKPGDNAFGQEEVKELMMKHLIKQDYTNICIIDDKTEIGRLFNLNGARENNSDIIPKDSLLKRANITGVSLPKLGEEKFAEKALRNAQAAVRDLNDPNAKHKTTLTPAQLKQNKEAAERSVQKAQADIQWTKTLKVDGQVRIVAELNKIAVYQPKESKSHRHPSIQIGGSEQRGAFTPRRDETKKTKPTRPDDTPKVSAHRGRTMSKGRGH